jgi:hypothetical protein
MGRYRRGSRFKATGYTEYSPVYRAPDPVGVVEPDYSQFTFQSKLTVQTERPVARNQGFFSAQQPSTETASPLTPDIVDNLLTSQIILSPFISSSSEFEAPEPRRAVLPARPQNPMYSGAWGIASSERIAV